MGRATNSFTSYVGHALEINYDKVDKVRGMNITICTSAKDDTQGKALLEAFSFPFRK